MNMREKQKEERKEKIMSAALDLFVRNGYEATTVKDIASEVGMSVGLMFHYFESKEKLYEELAKIGVMGPNSMTKYYNGSAADFFIEVSQMIMDTLKTQPDMAKMFVLITNAHLSNSTPESVKKIVAKINIMDSTVPIIEDGQKEGVIKTGNPMALSAAFWSAINGISEQVAGMPETPLPEGKWIADIVLK